MNAHDLTEGCRFALARAREEAVELGHDHVAPEHVFLGLLAAHDSIVPELLKRFRVDAAKLLHDVRVGIKLPGPTGGPDIPYTVRAKLTIELAMSEARYLGHGYVGCEHIFLGVIREGQSAVAEAFESCGITLEVARAEVLRMLRDDRVGPSFDWLVDLGTLTRQLSDSLVDVKHPRTPEDLLLVVVSDDCGARHILEVSGVTIDALKREILESGAGAVGGPTSLREFIQAAKNEQQFLGDCALASHHLLLAYLALRPAHGYRALSDRGVTHGSVRALAEKIFG